MSTHLDHIIKDLPERGHEHLTRENLRAKSPAQVFLACQDEIMSLRYMVEVVSATICTEVYTRDAKEGAAMLCDQIKDRLVRLCTVLSAAQASINQ